MSYLPRNHVHATFKSPSGGSGVFHAFGFYDAPAADANLTQASTTVTHGSANGAYAAHAFLVSAAAGTTDAGTVSVVVTGTSITSGGIRAAADSETIVADITALGANTYIESTKMWIGTITYTLTGAGGATTYALDFNYGFASVCHFWEKKVTIRQFEATGRAGAADNGFNVQLLKHSSVGWTYSAAAFVAGGAVLLDMNTDYNTEKNLISGKRFHYHRKGLTTIINGAAAATLTAPNEGVVVRITTGANNAVESMDMRILYG